MILSTGYELHLKWKKQKQQDKPTQNGTFKSVETPVDLIQVTKISTISVDELETNGKVPLEVGEVYESQGATGSTSILVQPNLQQAKTSGETLGMLQVIKSKEVNYKQTEKLQMTVYYLLKFLPSRNSLGVID